MKPFTRDNVFLDDEDTFILKNTNEAFSLHSDAVKSSDLKITTFELPHDIDPNEFLNGTQKEGTVETKGDKSVEDLLHSCRKPTAIQLEPVTASDYSLSLESSLFNEAENAVISAKTFKHDDVADSEEDDLYIDESAFDSSHDPHIADKDLDNNDASYATLNNIATIAVDNKFNSFNSNSPKEAVPVTVMTISDNKEIYNHVYADTNANAYASSDSNAYGDAHASTFGSNAHNATAPNATAYADTITSRDANPYGSAPTGANDTASSTANSYSSATHYANSSTNANDNQSLTVGIVGLGLIGGSLGRALVKRTSHTVLGKDLDSKIERTACHVKAIHSPIGDQGSLSAEGFGDLDILIFATNPRVTIDLLPKFVPLLKDGCIVLDMGGVKKGVVGAMGALSNRFSGLQFVSCHPMAGKEASGIKYSISTLFDNANMLLTDVNSSDNTKAVLEELFSAIGFSQNIWTTADKHDKIIAYTSQSCHAISASFALNSLATKHKGYSAGSFKDLTRVAKLNADMWTELFIDNSSNLSEVLTEFINTLNFLKTAVANGDEKAVKQFLVDANNKKENL